MLNQTPKRIAPSYTTPENFVVPSYTYYCVYCKQKFVALKIGPYEKIVCEVCDHTCRDCNRTFYRAFEIGERCRECTVAAAAGKKFYPDTVEHFIKLYEPEFYLEHQATNTWMYNDNITLLGWAVRDGFLTVEDYNRCNPFSPAQII